MEAKVEQQQSRPALINKGYAVRAVYLDSPIPDYQGNPLVEALPPVRTTNQAMSGLAYYPKYAESHRKLSDHIRYHLIQNGLKLFAPLDVHVDLERRFSCLIRVGYAERNPLTATFWDAVETSANSFDQYGDIYGSSRGDASWTAAGFNIVGMSGVGKSRSILRLLNLYPQVIHHSRYRDRDLTHSQVVWLKLDCPFDGSPKGLCIDFFNALDSILGTNYRRNKTGTRREHTELLSDMSVLAATHFLGVLVIDEIQRLSLARSGGADKMLNFFVHLINTIGVPVVLVGTYKALPLFDGSFSQMRRGTGQGDLIWDRMAKDGQWKLFVESMWRYQYTSGKHDLTPALIDALYDETQGITDLAVKVYMFAQERAVEKKIGITPSLIASVARDKLRIPRAVLDALRFKNKGALEKFEDVYPTILANFEPLIPKDAEVVGDLASMPEIQAVMRPQVGEATPATEAQGAGQDVGAAREAPSEVVTVEPPNSRVVFPPERTRRGKEKPSGSYKGELPKIVAGVGVKNGVTAYDALRQSGHVRSADEYILEMSEEGSIPTAPSIRSGED